MDDLDRSDRILLDAAEGWLGLGSHVEAFQELERLSPEVQNLPEVLRVRYHVAAAAKNWEMAMELGAMLCATAPETAFGPIHLAYALHEMRRTNEAWSVLLPVANRFPKEHIIAYNLACYACQLGNLDDSRAWLQKAIALAGLETIQKMASDKNHQGHQGTSRKSKPFGYRH